MEKLYKKVLRNNLKKTVFVTTTFYFVKQQKS